MNQNILKLIIISFYNITCILQRSIRLSSTYKSRATNASILNYFTLTKLLFNKWYVKDLVANVLEQLYVKWI